MGSPSQYNEDGEEDDDEEFMEVKDYDKDEE